MRIFPKESRAVGYLYLLNFVIPFYFAAILPAGAVRVAAMASLAVFAAVYVVSFRAAERGRPLCIAAETALTAVLVMVGGPGFGFMMIYPAVLAVIHRPRRKALFFPAALAAGLVGASAAWSALWSQPMGYYWGLIGTASLLSFASAAGVLWQARLVQANRELEDANARIQRLTLISERERISRELHDVMGHELSLIALKAQLAGRLVGRDPERARAEALDIERAARQALTRVREYIADIAQPSLREEWRRAAETLQAAGIHCAAEWEEGPPEGEPGAVALAMGLRESVTNVIRHSRAGQVWLHASRGGEGWRIEAADDGVGLPAAPDAQFREAAGGRGIPGMLARLSVVGGRAAVWSGGRWASGDPGPLFAALGRPGPFASGTAVCLWVPEAASPATEVRSGAGRGLRGSAGKAAGA